MKIILQLAINVFALLIVEYLIPGFILSDIRAAIVTAVVIGIVNTLIKPILQLITLPLSIFTFGITAFLINVTLLWLISIYVPGFEITNFATAILASIMLSLVSWFLHKLAK